jgi:hypothetical protein
MADPNKKEVRRMRALLQRMSEIAEHAEQSGSFEGAAHNYVKRYNAIVEHLEEEEVLAEDLFPKLDEDSDIGQLGAEAKLLGNYLDDIIEESPAPAGKGKGEKGEKGRADLGVLVALAPFLGSNELSKLVRQHFDKEAEEKVQPRAEPDLKTIIELAPHIDKVSLSKLVRNALARQSITDPRLLVELAPHMDAAEFAEILREQFPEWFGEPSATPPAPPAPPTPPAPPVPPSPGTWLQTLTEKLERG